MSYEQSKFGDGISTTKVANVSNHFGPRVTGKTAGVNKTEGAYNEMVITFDGTDVGDGDLGLETALILPAGAIVQRVYAKVSEAFVVGGTSATINIGTDGSEATNSFEITEAQAEAVGSYDLTSTLQGTWAAPLAAATTVGVAMDGTSPTVTSAGKCKVTIEYLNPSAV